MSDYPRPERLIINPDSEVGVVCHPEPRLVGANPPRRVCSCLLHSASTEKLRGCFAEFTLSELQRSFSRDCGIRMTTNGISITALTLRVSTALFFPKGDLGVGPQKRIAAKMFSPFRAGEDS